MYKIARGRGKLRAILFGWFFVAPIAASPTTELPHAIRTLVFLPTFQIFSAVGLTVLYSRYKNMILRILLAGFFVVNILYYFNMYFVHMNREYSQWWQYGYKEAVPYVSRIAGSYEKIVVSTKLEQPHMFFLFYLGYDPVSYLAQGGTASGGFAEVRNSFDKYEFRPIRWESETKDGSVLYVGTPDEIPSPNLTVVLYLDGKPAVAIADR
jgi:hypothetical protein